MYHITHNHAYEKTKKKNKEKEINVEERTDRGKKGVKRRKRAAPKRWTPPENILAAMRIPEIPAREARDTSASASASAKQLVPSFHLPKWVSEC